MNKGEYSLREVSFGTVRYGAFLLFSENISSSREELFSVNKKKELTIPYRTKQVETFRSGYWP